MPSLSLLLRRSSRIWISFLVLLGSSLEAAPKWRRLKTERYEILSQLSEKKTRAWSEEFSQYLSALRTEITPIDRLLSPLTVVLFADEDDFEPYRPARPDGKPQEVAGVFVSQETWAVIGMGRSLDDETTRRIIFHEGVHWYMHSLLFKTPHWLSEGLAEVFSTFEIRDGKMCWGTPIDWHILLLRQTPLIPADQLLAAQRNDNTFNDDEKTGIYYAQSWALVHYLMFGKREGDRSALAKYLDDWNRTGMGASATLLRGLGKSYKELNEALDSYINDGKYFIVNMPAPAKGVSKIEFTEASPYEVQLALARLAYGTDRRALADRHIGAAEKLAPARPAIMDLKVMLAAQDKDETNLGALVQQALDMGSTDAWTLVLAADGKLREHTVPSAAVARQAANLCELAINRRPNLENAYLTLANALSYVERRNEQDRRFIEQGRRFFPEDGRLALFQAIDAYKSGERQRAQALLGEALQRKESFPVESWSRVQQLDDAWAVEDLVKRLDEKARTSGHKAALADLDLWESGRTLGFELKQEVTRLRRVITFEVRSEEVRALLKAGNQGQAASLLDSLEKEYPGAEWRVQIGRLKKGLDGLSTDGVRSRSP